MTNRNWQRLQDLFEGALALAPAERANYLRRACGDDDELRAQVEALIATASEETGVIQEAIGTAATDTLLDNSGAGSEIGPYRVVRELGRGGMGAVYLAERADQEFEQRVALKIVGAGALNPKILERFLSERQILAGLEHPHIARLLDGGRTESGLPYFAMEFVDGLPVDEYCNRRRLSTSERLRLFRDVCAAVAFAHGRLVVHRDLKPSNILVTADGTPKLLDFGIAKLLEPSSAAAPVTVIGERAMTLEYASPEQVQGRPVSTATDVYALGLLLYELLTGRKGHRFPSHRSSDVELAVCEEQPERPSTAVTGEPGPGDTTSADEIGRARSATPATLKKRLQGDLDNIVLMALRKEPERRYSSVAEFSEDIARHLSGLPVRAHPDSFDYRARKFVRRHSGALASALGVALLVASLTGFYTGRLADERDRARREAEKASQTASFLRSLFEVSDPDRAAGTRITTEEVLDAGAEAIRSDGALDPETRADMLLLVGDIYRKQALFEKSRALLTEAVETSGLAYGPRSGEHGAARFALGRAVFDGGDPASALPSFEEALEIRQAVHGGDSIEVAEVLNQMSIAMINSGRAAEGEPLAARALEILEARYGGEDPRIADALNQLATAAWYRGDFTEAEGRYRRVLALRERELGLEHRKVADALQSIAVALMQQNREDAALPLYERAGAIYRTVLGELHPSYASILEGQAAVHGRRGDFAAAGETYRGVLAIYENEKGRNDLAAAITLGNLGRVARLRGSLEEAVAWGRRSLEVVAELDNPRTLAWLEATLAATFLEANELARAASGFERAIALREAAAPGHPSLAGSLVELGEVRRRQGRRSEAETLFQRALPMMESALEPESSDLAQGRARWAMLLVEEGDCDAARELLDRSLPVLRANAARVGADLPRAEAAAAECGKG